MTKYYKNVTNHQLRVTLFGVGEVVVSADAACVPLEESTAKTINQMVFPTVALKEVEYTPIEKVLPLEVKTRQGKRR